MAQVAPGYSAVEIEQLERAKVGNSVAAAPASPIVPVEAENEAQSSLRRRFILWSVLGFGVLMLGFMSWRLYGQLNAGEDNKGRPNDGNCD